MCAACWGYAVQELVDKCWLNGKKTHEVALVELQEDARGGSRGRWRAGPQLSGPGHVATFFFRSGDFFDKGFTFCAAWWGQLR